MWVDLRRILPLACWRSGEAKFHVKEKIYPTPGKRGGCGEGGNFADNARGKERKKTK